jgi:hypothetical protein
VYKSFYKPSQVACPITFNYVYITDEVKDKIKEKSLPRLAPEELSPVYEQGVDKKYLEKGMRTVLKMEDGKTLSIFNLNPAGQKLLGKMLPDIFKHIGLDLIDNFEFILD